MNSLIKVLRAAIPGAPDEVGRALCDLEGIIERAESWVQGQEREIDNLRKKNAELLQEVERLTSTIAAVRACDNDHDEWRSCDDHLNAVRRVLARSDREARGE